MTKVFKIMLVVLTSIFVFIVGFYVFNLTTNAGNLEKIPQTKDFEYAIIFYPDMNKSIEGYIDRYVIYSDDTIQVTIDEVCYLTNTRNVLIIKNKDLKVEKEKEVINVQEPEQSDN